jgi:CheY-like chemotaxis protein
MGNAYTRGKGLVHHKIVNSNIPNRTQGSNLHTGSADKYKKNHKHLICDDAYANRLVLKKYLVLYGCEVDEAENGLDAIEKVKENGIYDVIWMDIKMPKMDGHDCTHYLRENMDYAGKIIGLTGYVDDLSVKKCYTVGMDVVVPKPFDTKVVNMYVEENRS